ncbi:MAG: MBL fold metallo-hydrolase, partial [Theionarchaea archaeon]|nr:MBL fold metallo-hydrolase [Theionarchaea archaeon]
QLTWLGQSGFQIKTTQGILYIDVVYYKKYEKKIGGLFEKADLVLITHAHGDHCQPATVQKIKTEATVVIAPPQCVKKIKGEIESLAPGEEKIHNGITVGAVEAYNITRFRTPGNPWHPKGYGVGYLVTVAGKTIYHAGDTDFIPEMRNLGKVDVALLPTGDRYTMDNFEAAQAARAINPGVVLSMHRWDTDPEIFREQVEATSDITVAILQEGESYGLD